MKKVLRTLFGFIAFFTFAVTSTGGAETANTNGTTVVDSGTITPDCGSGDYGVMN